MPKKITSIYRCSSCGFESKKWLGQCPTCKEWNTLEEGSVSPIKTSSRSSLSAPKTMRLKDVKMRKNDRLLSDISEFDRVVGQGIVRDSVTIMSAPPGAGKSTLCLQLADKYISKGLNVLYAAGEESSSQIKTRADRLGLTKTEDLWIIDDTNLDVVLDEIDKNEIDVLFLDSIQTFYLNEYLPSRAGNITQVNECTAALIDRAKRCGKELAVILIGQQTKDEELAGSRTLEHMVDTYLRIEGDRDDTLRTLFAVKNRYGNVGETGFFNMTEEGLECIENPSEYFMTTRKTEAVGVSLTVLKEGTRPIITEIESIVSMSFTPFPSRIGDSLKKDQLNILTSILEQRASLKLMNRNIVIKTMGGIKLSDPSANLAILMTIVSSYYSKPIAIGTVFIADVGLTGELKKVPNLDTKLKELDRLGYKRAFVAKGTKHSVFKTLEVIECNTLREVINQTINYYPT